MEVGTAVGKAHAAWKGESLFLGLRGLFLPQSLVASHQGRLFCLSWGLGWGNLSAAIPGTKSSL